jgi:DNA-binding CsgD family transcriptional regulator
MTENRTAEDQFKELAEAHAYIEEILREGRKHLTYEAIDSLERRNRVHESKLLRIFLADYDAVPIYGQPIGRVIQFFDAIASKIPRLDARPWNEELTRGFAEEDLEDRPDLEIRRDRNPDKQLSSIEIDCCRLVAEGMKDHEIGHELNISPHTVREHVDRARSHLGARTRAQLVGMLVRRGRI